MKVKKKPFAALASIILIASMAVTLGGTSALGDTVSSAKAGAYGLQLGGPVPVGPIPTVTADAPNGSAADCVLEIPAAPAVTSGTACVEADATTESTLNATHQATMDAQSPGLPTKWNARGYAITEDLGAISDTVLVDVVESESTAACVDGNTVFGSAVRVVNLTVAGTQIPILNPTPNQVIFDQLGIRIVFWETNWDPATGGTTNGSPTVFTNALHITGPAGVDLIVSHSEASASCAAAQDLKQCEDGQDNDGDGLIDEDDPGCHTDGNPDNPNSYNPKDDDERDARARDLKQCEDGVDNDGDGVIDEDDPGCHTDGDPNNPDSYRPKDDDERDGVGAGGVTAPPAPAVDAQPASAVEAQPDFTG